MGCELCDSTGMCLSPRLAGGGDNELYFQWFLESVECGYCLEECNYVVDEGAKKNVPDDAYQSDWSDRLDQFVVPSHVSSCLLDGCKVCKHSYRDVIGYLYCRCA